MTRTAWHQLWHTYRWLRHRHCSPGEALAFSAKHSAEARRAVSIAAGSACL